MPDEPVTGALPADDKLSAALSALGDRIGPAQRKIVESAGASPGDYARAAFASGELVTVARKALAALDAVLALHEPRPAHGPPGGLACGHCTDAGGGTLLVTWPCRTRRAVLAALTGKEAPGAEAD